MDVQCFGLPPGRAFGKMTAVTDLYYGFRTRVSTFQETRTTKGCGSTTLAFSGRGNTSVRGRLVPGMF